MTNNVRIEQLHLRLPGVSRYEGRHLGITVARQLARQLPGITREKNLSTVNLRLTIPAGTPRERLGPLIAAEIAKRIS